MFTKNFHAFFLLFFFWIKPWIKNKCNISIPRRCFFFTILGFKISRAVNEKRSFVEILSFVKEKNSSAYYDNSQYVLQTSNITNKHPRKSFVFLIIQRIYLLHPDVKNLCFILLFMHFQVQPIFQIFSTKNCFASSVCLTLTVIYCYIIYLSLAY